MNGPARVNANGASRYVPPEGRVRWDVISVIVVTLLCAIMGSLSLANVGLLKHVGSYGGLILTGVVLTPLIASVIHKCCKPKAIESVCNSLLLQFHESDKTNSVEVFVFVHAFRRQPAVYGQFHFHAMRGANFRETLKAGLDHLRFLKEERLENLKVEVICVDKRIDGDWSLNHTRFAPEYPAPWGEIHSCTSENVKTTLAQRQLLYVAQPFDFNLINFQS